LLKTYVKNEPIDDLLILLYLAKFATRTRGGGEPASECEAVRVRGGELYR